MADDHIHWQKRECGEVSQPGRVGFNLNPSQPAGGTTLREDLDPALWAPGSKPVSKAWTNSLFTRTLAGQAISLFWSPFPYLFCINDNPTSSL